MASETKYSELFHRLLMAAYRLHPIRAVVVGMHFERVRRRRDRERIEQKKLSTAHARITSSITEDPA